MLDLFDSKRIFITGHTGFKGSWLFESLSMIGSDLLGYALEPEQLSHFNQLGLERHLGRNHFGDLRDYDDLRQTIAEFQPEVVFHLAAQPLVSRSFKDPRETFETNFMGGVNLLEACRQIKNLSCVVFITSDKAYENVEWNFGYRENDRLGGSDPYSASKGAIELAASSYLRSFYNSSGIKLVTARAGNVIGGGDWSKDRVVPDIVRALSSGEQVRLRNPHSTRPWQHVLEPISGYLTLAASCLQGHNLQASYNFGPSSSRSHTVEDLTQALLRELDYSQELISSTASKLTHEANLLQLNCDLAKSDLGWSSKWDFDRTVSETAFWYGSYLSGLSVAEVTKRQIEEYFSG